MITRIYLLCVVFLLSTGFSQGQQYKVTQKSVKKAPVWLNMTEQDYIITSAISSDVEKAKNECLDNIRKYIIDAVAQNVKASSESNIQQKSVNNSITQFLDNYSYTAQTQSANVPYLKGISFSKVADSYWEKREEKGTKKTSYLYSVKYPFPSLELKKLVHEFDRIDSEMVSKLNALENGYKQSNTVEQIDKAIADLNPLISYFFDDIRKNAAQTLQNNYRELYRQIAFREISNEPGTYEFALTLGGNDIEIARRPELKSATLTQLRAEQNEKKWKVNYNYATCDLSEENSGAIIFRIGGKTLTNNFYPNLSANEIQVRPTKEMYLTANRRDSSSVSNIKIRMNMESNSSKSIRIYNITLNIPGLSEPLFVNDLNLIIDSPGIQSVQFTYNGTIGVLEGQNNRENLLRGYMEIIQDGKNRRVDFSLPFKANW